MYAIANSINTHEGWLHIEQIIALAKTAGLLTNENENQIIETILPNETWLENNQINIEKVLNGEDVPEDTTPAPVTSAPETTVTSSPTTTQGAGSLIASFSIIVSCA